MAINKVVFGNDTLIDLTEDSVSASNLLEGETAHDRSGTSVTGTAKQGHIIQNVNGTDLTQMAKLQFADADVTDDSTNQKTIVNVVRERTQAEYDDMSAADQAKGIIHISDANAKPLFASQVRYGDGTVEDVLTPEQVQITAQSPFRFTGTSNKDVYKVSNLCLLNCELAVDSAATFSAGTLVATDLPLPKYQYAFICFTADNQRMYLYVNTSGELRIYSACTVSAYSFFRFNAVYILA